MNIRKSIVVAGLFALSSFPVAATAAEIDDKLTSLALVTAPYVSHAISCQSPEAEIALQRAVLAVTQRRGNVTSFLEFTTAQAKVGLLTRKCNQELLGEWRQSFERGLTRYLSGE